jgi:RHS repeat-associated protein
VSAQEQTTAVTVPGLSVQTYGYRGPGQTERATAASHPNGDTAYATGPLGVTATVDSSGRTGVVRDPAEAIVALRHPDGRRSYPLADALGSVVALTDAASGAVTNRYAYDPYGATTETRLAGAVDNPWRYTGAYQDPTGLYKMGARYYQPELGRWTQKDPSRIDVNPYTYTSTNPVTASDPTGLVTVSGCASGAIGLPIVIRLQLCIVAGADGPAITGSVGMGPGFAVNLGFSGQVTSAATVCDLEGVSSTFSFAAGPGGSVTIGFDDIGPSYVGLGIGGKLAIEASFTLDLTSVFIAAGCE